MATLVQSETAEAELEAKVRAIDLPTGIRFRRVYYDTDGTGDDAVFAVFSVSKKLGIKKSTIEALHFVRTTAAREMRETREDLYAYVEFEEAA